MDTFGPVSLPATPRSPVAFRPYLYVLASRSIPTSITCMAYINVPCWRYLPIPRAVLARSEAAQRGWVRWQCQRHFKDERGVCLLFGRITGYV